MRGSCLVAAVWLACGPASPAVSMAAPPAKEALIELVAQQAEFQKQSDLFNEASQLEQDGEDLRAFAMYLSLDGGESSAMRIARPNAAAYLIKLQREAKSIPAARKTLIETELQLAIGEQERALEGYRAVAKMLVAPDDDGWINGALPRRGFFREQAGHTPGAYRQWDDAGSGSHRDNWLIRRFIALESLDDAEREYARVWQNYRLATEPFVLEYVNWSGGLPHTTPDPEAMTLVRELHRPAGFSMAAMRFAMDFAQFLMRKNETERAKELLLEVVLRLDMDRSPEDRLPGTPLKEDEGRDLRVVRRGLYGRGSSGPQAGLSRADFLRRTLGLFQSLHAQPQLIEAVTVKIAAGENRLRRVLARIHLMMGQTESAMSLELAYLEHCRLDECSMALRKATLFADANRPNEAIVAAERALELIGALNRETAVLDVPDFAEKSIEPNQGFGQYASAYGFGFGGAHGNRVPQLEHELLATLERLYAGQGNTDKSLVLARRQAIVHRTLNHLALLSELQRKHTAANQAALFDEWLDQQVRESNEPGKQIAVYLLRKDWARATAEIVKLPIEQAGNWKNYFVGKDARREFLVALIKAHPDDARSRLELFDLDGEPTEADRIIRLELLLTTEKWGPHGKGGLPDAPLNNQYEVVYRLMRLYLEQNKLDKLHQYGLQLARHEKPFDGVLPTAEFTRHPMSHLELGEAALALAIQHASTEEQQRSLTEALGKSRWISARAQMARRLAGSGVEQPKPARVVPWAIVPPGAELFASNENVLALARDEEYVYSGHPWGVAVYDFAGTLVVRIPLGDAARALVSAHGHLWAGTPKGLFRITHRAVPREGNVDKDDAISESEAWSVAHQPLNGDIPPDPKDTRGESYGNGVYALAAENDELWIGLHRNVQVLNMRRLELRAFSGEELDVQHWGAFDRIAFDGRYVWVDSTQVGLRRYDRETEEWAGIETEKNQGPHRIRFVGIVDDQVWGSLYVDDRLRHRPCRIDRQSLAVTPLRLALRDPTYQMINQPLFFIGKREVADRPGKQLVFGTNSPEYFFDVEANVLKFLPASVRTIPDHANGVGNGLAAGDVSGLEAPSDDDRYKKARQKLQRWNWLSNNFGVNEVTSQTGFEDWCGLTLPDGTRVLGARQNRTRYEYPHEDTHRTEAASQYEARPEAGGLFYINARGEINRVSSQPISTGLPADTVYSVLKADGLWVCTVGGAVRMDWQPTPPESGGSRLSVVEKYDRLNGLCSNRVLAAVRGTGLPTTAKLYFATGWDDSSGGLAIFDPATRVFTTMTHFDGLPTDKLESISWEQSFATDIPDGRLKLEFAAEYLRYQQRSGESFRRYPPALLDTVTGKVIPGGPAAFISQDSAYGIVRGAKPVDRALPFLGGNARDGVTKHENVNYLHGTRGMVGLPEGVAPAPMAALGAKLDAPRLLLWRDAMARSVAVTTIDQFRQAMSDKNPLYRTRVLSELFSRNPGKGHSFLTAEAIPEIGRQLTEKELRLRSTALYALSRFEDQNALTVPLFKSCLNDKAPVIRSFAAQELIRRRALADDRQLRDAFQLASRVGNYPFGLNASAGTRLVPPQLMKLLVEQDLPVAIELALEFNLQVADSERRQLVAGIGRVLRKHPAKASVLLAAYDPDRNGPWRRDLACDIFQAAGNEMLPILQTALTSPDRVVRSNAARACGAIGDPRAVPWLMEAADLESGLSRASIVWGLGKLQARESLPLLARLYAEAQFAEQNRERADLRFSQQGAMFSAQMDQISDVDSLRSEWDEMKRAAKPGSRSPESVDHEDLLTAEKILKGVEQIGPEHSFAFYRSLAGSSFSPARIKAAEYLGSGPERDEAVSLLKGLLTDSEQRVRGHAALRLIRLGDSSGEPVILELLNASDGPSIWIDQLAMKTNPTQRAFAAPTLRTLLSRAPNGELKAKLMRLVTP